MKHLIDLAKSQPASPNEAPFAIYSSLKEQCICNVPIVNPMLVLVLSGAKQLGRGDPVTCHSGHFVFLSNTPDLDMRNIPNSEEYFAVLIEFEYGDFTPFQPTEKRCKTNESTSTHSYVMGAIDGKLEKALAQFFELPHFATAEIIKLRKQELLWHIYLAGHQKIGTIAAPPSLSHQVQRLISAEIAKDWSAQELAAKLCLSESTLRRKLKAEGTGLQILKNQLKLGYGLHLIQTTMGQIGLIAEQCGYQSQSRFTDQFKQLFGMTPSELRKTRIK
tara:strand:+ start:2852 stop:3679 length:828 start_codon:yes stop_codon:yes gene_type:complete